MRVFAIFCMLWLFFYLSGCSSQQEIVLRPSISPAEEPVAAIQPEAVPVMTSEQLVRGYEQVLGSLQDESRRRGVMMRLADLKLRISEDKLIDGEVDESVFSEPIALYEELLKNADDSERLRLQYQLSKAYALAGEVGKARDVMANMAYDQSGTTSDQVGTGYDQAGTGYDQAGTAGQQAPGELKSQALLTESRFRLAEAAFSRESYMEARELYQAVLADQDSVFRQNAHYMLGWSEFKLNEYDAAIESFVAVLDKLLMAGTEMEELAVAEQNLASDSLRAMSIAFSYMGGVDSIIETLARLGDREYSDRLYTGLGNLYRSQERYRDAADTFLAFVAREPYSPKAPDFSLLAIEIYYEGNFPGLILDAKRGFVDSYGIDSMFWLAQEPEDQESLKPVLHEYLQELASHYHALAQSQMQELETAEPPADYRQNLLWAADYYGQFVRTFPQDPQVQEKAFLRGEALFDVGMFADAADAYEFVAYALDTQGQEEYGVKAAYNYILTIDSVLEEMRPTDPGRIADPQLPEWEQRKLDSLIRFADYYPDDQRAPLVLSQALELQYDNQAYAQVILLAERLRNWPLPDPASEYYDQYYDQYVEIGRQATFVSAQSQFILGNYSVAEMLFRQSRLELPPEDPRYADAGRQVAASLYRQAELLEATEPLVAVDKLIAAADYLPQSEIGAVARYDAANLLMENTQWDRSIEQLLIFSEAYPDHQFNRDIPAKLAVLYQETEQWQLAADNLVLLALAEESESELQSQSIYLAAELYQRAGADSSARNTFESYVEKYAENQLLKMEAEYQLTRLTRGGDRDYWVKQLANAANLQIGRELYLSAWANNQLADLAYQDFASKSLTLPLNASLRAKQEAMQRALDAYLKVLDFGVAEFNTQASFRMGEIYVDLSQAIMNSERPDDLDALALEQYEILLEEQAFPIEEKAIQLHEANARKSWEGVYDDWVKQSIASLAALLPVRYNKAELLAEVSHGIH